MISLLFFDGVGKPHRTTIRKREKEGIQMKFISDMYENVEQMLNDFEEKELILEGIELMVVIGESEMYSENLACIYKKENEFYMFKASHCSCYGFEGQWDANITSIQMIEHYAEKGYGDIKNCAQRFLKEITK